MSHAGTPPTFEEQTASFKAFATTDGEVSPGGDHPDETKAAAQRAVDDAAAAEAAQQPEATAEVAATPDSGEVTQLAADEPEVDITKPKPKKTAAERQADIQKRIDASTRELREIERRIEAAKTASVASPQQGLTEKTQVATDDADAPKPTDFEYGELDGKYVKALAQHEAKRAFAALKAEDAQRTQQAAVTREQAENRQKIQAMTVKGSAKYDDFEELVVQGALGPTPTYPISETVGRLILGSDVGVDIAYHLASNPKEARLLAGKAPIEQAAYFGRLEARFSAPASGATAAKVAKTTQAPPAPQHTARGGGGSTQTSPATTDFASFERMHREAQR